MPIVALSREEARRLAVRAQLLTADRPADILETVDGLAAVDIDPTAAIAPSADLILWSRLGWPYQHADLVRLVEVDRAIVEWRGFYRPTTDLPMLLPLTRGEPRYVAEREWLAANDAFRQQVIDRVRAEGALHAAEIPDTAATAWRSTGWSAGRNVTKMLDILTATGVTAVSGRDAGGRRWDLAERVYPAGLPELSAGQAARERAETRLRILGVASRAALTGDDRGADAPDLDGIGVEAEIEGAPGVWCVESELLAGLDDVTSRAALLSPFDRLVADRVRLERLFDFEYLLEMYTPKAKRRWGYFALPILVGDRLVGKLDARADHRAGMLRIAAVHEDVPFDEEMSLAVDREIAELAQWLGLEVARPAP